MVIEAVLWYLLLADSLFANAGAWLFPNWYKNNFRKLHKQLPLTKLWAAIYLVLIVWVGYGLVRLGII